MSFFLKSLLLILLVFFSVASWSSLNPAKGGLENDILYYVMVDRFYNADIDNDIPTFAFPEDSKIDERNRKVLTMSFDPSKRYMGLYWGGDLQGVINKLDYIKELGITKIVLLPIMENANGWIYNHGQDYLLRVEESPEASYLEKEAKSRMTAYHGYWIKDLFEIDEHFRDSKAPFEKRFEILKILLREANKRDLGVVLDITFNHSSPTQFLYDERLVNETSPEKIWGGVLIDNGSLYRQRKLVARTIDPESRILNPEGWFNPILDIDFDKRPPKIYEELTRLPGRLGDLNQEYDETEQYLLDAAEFWLRFNTDNEREEDNVPINGFRLDAVKHARNSFWQKFEQRVFKVWDEIKENKKIIKENRIENVIIFGEYFESGLYHKESLIYLSKVKHQSFFDFGLSVPMRQFFGGERHWGGRVQTLMDQTLIRGSARYGNYQNSNNLGQKWKNILDNNPLDIPFEHLNMSEIKNEDYLGWVTFLESHDLPRLKSYYPDMSDAAYISATRFQFCARGVPLVMYGAETALSVPYHPQHQGLFGLGGDPFNRPMMIFPGHKGFKKHIFTATKEMIKIRKKNPVLRYGETRFLSLTDSQNIFMLRFAKNIEQGKSAVLYVYSTNGGEYQIDLKKENIPRYRGMTNTFGSAEISFNNDVIKISLKNNRSVVFVFD